MKKLSLMAALLAAAASAHAQSNVTLFGLIDLNLSRYSPGSRSNGAGLTAMNDGHTNGLNGSRWGIRANEDLGGGLKASVVIESGVLADTGNLGQGGRGFGRQRRAAEPADHSEPDRGADCRAPGRGADLRPRAGDGGRGRRGCGRNV